MIAIVLMFLGVGKCWMTSILFHDGVIPDGDNINPKNLTSAINLDLSSFNVCVLFVRIFCHNVYTDLK